MSDMRKLLESMDKFAGEPEQKKGDQVRGTDNPKKSEKKHGFHGRLVGENLDEFAQQLLKEYRMFVEEPLNTAVADNTKSPVANINPAGQGTSATNPSANPNSTSSEKEPLKTGAETTQQAGTQNQTQTQQQAQQAAQNQNQQQVDPKIQAAQNMKAKQDLTQNVSSLKQLNPAINVPKVVSALQTDPKHLTPLDSEALGKLADTIEPILTDKQASGGMKSVIQRLHKV